MPVGYLVTVIVVAVSTLFALVPQRSLPNLSFRLGLLLNEVPMIGFYWLLIWASLAFAEGDINSPGGWATVGLAALTTAGCAPGCRLPASCSCRCHAAGAATSSGWQTSPTATPAAATSSTCTVTAPTQRAARS